MENTSNILVIGGTGKTGRKVVQGLKEAGHKVRIGSRSASPAFDWDQPKTWSGSLQGMEKVYITFQPDLAVPGALKAIEVLIGKAKQAGVKKVVLLSGKGEREAELCEQVVIHSGLDYTIVRASWFNQNFSESFLLEPILDGFVALPQADVKVPFVDTDDIADVVVAALLKGEHNGNIYQLTGPRQLTFKEVIHEISEATGRNIAFTSITLSAYAQVMKQQGVPADYVWLIEYLFSEVLGNPNIAEMTNDIEKVLGRRPKDISKYIEETVATGVWYPQAN
ncbi:NmrA family NAD(P)-binding protein [Arenibacter sp. M-2]|uniref:NmrA family NAD(P)-binding protein n=1 Tax=Arenibacter sp. M-2 TaxID=3053612 RepID=UPI00257056EA|nr:NmrA family NAD(P)-binding protein [Arenibacter sp. M-2]MDL5514286.1 NmrA family NAD(P)-binding protein [Arenibacter sp. M-2]